MSTSLFTDNAMTIIVAGRTEVQLGQRQRFLDGSQTAMRLAREGLAHGTPSPPTPVHHAKHA